MRERTPGILGRSFDPSAWDFPLVASAFVFVVLVHGSPAKAAVGFLLTTVALVFSDLRRNPVFWWVAAAVWGTWYLLDWRVLDNHVALSVYWVVAVAIALHFEDWDDRLARAARLMIGAVFLLAVVWKLRSPDFLGGGFFEYTLVVDPRFEPIARLLGLTAEDLSMNRQVVQAGMAGVLSSNPQVERFADLLTIGTLAVEGGIALAWLLPIRLRAVHHVLLGVFAIVTYLLVPVVGFGFILLVMGVVTTGNPATRARYAIGAAGLFVYGAIWNALVL